MQSDRFFHYFRQIISHTYFFLCLFFHIPESQTEVKRRDHKMVEKVTELDEAIKSMKEEYGRKVSVDEVAERLGISEDEIEDILKLAGEEVKDEE